jgi:Rieske Fe-S protein
MEKELLSRRSFCTTAAKVTIGLTLANAITHKAEASSNEVVIDLSLSANNVLTKIGGALYVTMPSNNEKVVVVRNSNTEVSAFSSVCPHMGCQVNLPANGVATCPCHGSQFSEKGVVVKGPAATDLKKYTAVLQGNLVYVNSASLTAIERSSGTKELSPIVSWHKERETLTIAWGNGTAGQKIISLFDMQGRRWGRQAWDGKGSYVLPTGRIPRGEYFLRIEAKQEEPIVKRVRVY